MRFSEKLVKFWAWASMFLVLASILFLFSFIFVQGAHTVTWEFLTQPPRGSILGAEGGIFPAIVGSFCFTLLAVLMAAIPAIAAALYVVFYAKKNRSTVLIRMVVQCISGIPSIVLGLFSYSFMVRELGLGRCILSSATALAIMILPFLEVRAEKSFQEFPRQLFKASSALGVSKGCTIWKMVLPCCRGELLSGMILGGCYAMGATAPLMFTGAVAYAGNPHSILEPAMALPLHLYLLLAQGASSIEKAYGTAFVMLALLLLSNLLATAYERKRSHWKTF